MPAPKDITRVIDQFERNADAYRSPGFNETQCRREFIDPFFKCLGIHGFALFMLLMCAIWQPAHAQKLQVDRLKDPLPDGAIARLGTGRFSHPDFVETTAWSHKGDRFASSCVAGPTVLWEWPTGKKLHELPVKPRQMAFSPDGHWLATVAGWFELWSVARGEQNLVMPFKLRNGTTFAFSADGKLLATAGKDWCGDWNFGNSKVREYQVPDHAKLLAIGYNADNQLLAAGTLKDQVILWHVTKKWRAFPLMPADANLYCMAFSPDGRKLAVPRPDLSIAIYETETGKLWAEFQGGHVNLRFQNPSRIASLQFNFDGSRLASASWDTTVCLWDVHEKKKLFNVTDLNGTGKVSFSPDKKLLATSGSNHPHRAVFWEAGTGKLADPYPQHYSNLRSLAVSPDGKFVATASGTRDDPWIHLWEAKSGMPIRSLFGHRGGIGEVRFSPDGTLLASGGTDRTVKIWDVQSGNLRFTLKGEHSWITHLAFSPNGKWLASGDNSIKQGNYFGKTCVWDVQSGMLVKLLEGQSGAIDSLAFTPDSKRLLTGAAGIRVWKTADWTWERDFATDVGRVWALALSPDGRFVFTGYSGVPRLWEWKTGQVVATLPKEYAGHACGFTRDGRTVAIVTSDGKLLLWHGPTQKAIWERPRAQHPLAFSPRGDWLVTGEMQVPAALVWALPADMLHLTIEKRAYDSNRFLQAWRRLAGPAAESYAALWECVGMGDAILAELKKHWHRERELDPSIRTWIKELDDKNFKVRERAYRNLKEAATLAVPLIKQTLAKSASLEQTRRLEELLRTAKEMDIGQRRHRTMLLLEEIGTAAAARTLAELGSNDSDPELREEAQLALDRLKSRKGP